jgi:hypothetical protein
VCNGIIMITFLRVLIVGILFTLTRYQDLSAFQISDPPLNTIEHHFDIRPVYYYVNTTERDGANHTSHTLNLRARYGISYHFRDNLTFRGRAAMRLSSDQDKFRFLLDDHTGGSGTYPPGTATADEFMLGWQIKPELKLTAGRFQARFPLAGFIPKGVDRYYGANLSVAHTDGLWMEWDMTRSWRLHVIGSHNSPSGSTHAARSPLRFDESVMARFSSFVNLQHRNRGDRWVQREISISLTPQNFYRDGELRDHVAISTRWMYRPAFSISGEEYHIGGEVGFIPFAPKPTDTGLQIRDERLLFSRSAFAWQLSAYAINFLNNHRVGILYGQTDPHWLISSSYAPNVTMAEMRYRYTIAAWINYEFRLRFRDEIYRPSGASQTREIVDFYTRFTVSF